MKPGVAACKRYFNKNRDAINARRRKWRAAIGPEAINAKYAEHRQKYYERCRDRDLRKYGMTHQCYERMLATQDYGCRLCGAGVWEEPHHVLCVDHDHSTGQVRGLLCRRCNKALGGFRDDPQLLVNAALYIQRKGPYRYELPHLRP